MEHMERILMKGHIVPLSEIFRGTTILKRIVVD
jgi:hypothetical protein